MVNSMMPHHETIQRVYLQAFDSWASKDKKYKPLYDKLGEGRQIVSAALGEIDEMKPGFFDVWWARHHARFMRSVPQKESRLAHELTYHFLTKFARGELKTDAKEKGQVKTKKRKTSASGK